MSKLSKILIFAGIGFAFGPLVVALLSFPLSALFGCVDAGANPPVCAIGGSGMGEALWMLAMLHWVTLATLIPGLGLSLAGIVLVVVARVRRNREEIK